MKEVLNLKFNVPSVFHGDEQGTFTSNTSRYDHRTEWVVSYMV